MQAVSTNNLEAVRLAQRHWASAGLPARLQVLAQLRKLLASGARELAETVPTHLPGALNRTVADTLVAEVLPVASAIRFLEQQAQSLLRPRDLGHSGRPVWLGLVETRVERAPWGVVLIIAAANYPLLLAGVQVAQALAAGNAVLWKPAPGTEAVAFAFKTLLVEAGLAPELLTVLDSTVEAASTALASGVDFVVLTGSATTGTAVLHQLAETLTPATLELSGCDSVFVLNSADLDHVLDALAFGLRFNGSFTCMAPRRVFLIGFSPEQADAFEARLAGTLASLPALDLPNRTRALLDELIEDAHALGAQIKLDGRTPGIPTHATLLTQATPAMRALSTDIFAPILSIVRVRDAGEALAADAACPYALTAAIFGSEPEARSLADGLRVGNIVVNDVIAPTADPRMSFGGRLRSGYGVTRGAEGLLAMTTPKTIQVKRGRLKPIYQPTGETHIELFAGIIELLYGSWLAKSNGLRRLIAAARKLK